MTLWSDEDDGSVNCRVEGRGGAVSSVPANMANERVPRTHPPLPPKQEGIDFFNNNLSDKFVPLNIKEGKTYRGELSHVLKGLHLMC